MLKAICRSILKEKLQRQMKLRAVMELRACPQMVTRIPDVEEFHDINEARMVTKTLVWDDLTGMKIDCGKGKEARQKTFEYVRRKEVWKKISRRQAIANG